MRKLDPEDQISATEEVLTKILALYSISEFSSRPITEGIANTSFVIESSGKKHVLRIYAQGKKSDEEINFEVSFQDFLREREIPIPLIYPNADGKELTVTEIDGKRWQSILMQFVEGQSVTAHPVPSLVAELANLQAKMHLLGIEFAAETNKAKSPWTELRDSLAEKIQEIPLNRQEIADFVERVKSFRYPLNPNLPHGYNHLDIDFDGNVITSEDQVKGIVDFGDLKYSPIVVCLGYSMWNILDDEGAEVMWQYLREYEKIRPLNSMEREALPHAIFFRNYMVGIVRLLLWEEGDDLADITDILKLEKEILTIT